jgi:hypothetical protein
MSDINPPKFTRDFIPLGSGLGDEKDTAEWEEELVKRGGLKSVNLENREKIPFGVIKNPNYESNYEGFSKMGVRDSGHIVVAGVSIENQDLYGEKENRKDDRKMNRSNDRDGLTIDDIQSALQRAMEGMG